MTRPRYSPTPLEVATLMARQREAAERERGNPSRALPPRGGLANRLLLCDACRAVWPTERDEHHGGSRQDGEPCAYVWQGSVCQGRVWPMHDHQRAYQHTPEDFTSFVEPRRDCAPWWQVLGLPSSTKALALVRARYRLLAKERHPDAGGTHAAMLALNEAYRQALSELGQP